MEQLKSNIENQLLQLFNKKMTAKKLIPTNYCVSKSYNSVNYLIAIPVKDYTAHQLALDLFTRFNKVVKAKKKEDWEGKGTNVKLSIISFILNLKEIGNTELTTVKLEVSFRLFVETEETCPDCGCVNSHKEGCQ